ncbi:MAG: PSD1 and planctomycete cytochrome C domain-containing protein [Gemmataceae bacterium]
MPPSRIVAWVVVAAIGSVSRLPAADPDFNRDVRPILSNNCFACHGPDEKALKAGLRLDTRDGAIESAVVPGKPAESELVKRVTTADPGELMPPPKTGKKLTPAEVDVLTRWIKAGAPYAVHWSYAKPVRPPVPSEGKSEKENGKSPIDAFLSAKLRAAGLGFQPEADRYTLARRAALDLTGLPPNLEEVEAFVSDKAADAYERYVDRQLAKPAFGEHWARMWLDLARYADSAGYADDPPRTIWPYRDWVIRAFNRNLPFDRFTVEQIAGDLLPNPTDDQRIATAFHRNTMTNSEGGTDDEEFRNAAVVDRVNTTLAVWMGTSAACAQCHTHKYDPITQTEYFRLFAVFNNTADADRRDESPVLSVGDTKAKAAARAALDRRVKGLEKAAKHQPGLVQAGLAVQANKLRAEQAALAPATTVPVMKELPAGQRRVTKLQRRGNFQDTADVVTEGVPAALHPLPKGEPVNRLALAKWLVSPDNPLTARVTVNRFWEQVFGAGLVRTAEEFGAQGELPTHPELLDWLAVEFQDGLKWDVKRLLMLLVTSQAYRQSSRVTPEALAKDPDNKLLSRGPRFRLPAETVRDQALAVAGLLSPKLYGPPARPPQPAFGLNAAFGRSMDWQTSPGEDRYRRGIYTEWRRTNPYPSMTTFDAPSREACTLRRVRTNTPLQALVTLNDPVYVEAAQGLARRMAAKPGTAGEKAAWGVRLTLGRPATAAETARLVTLFEAAKAKYVSDKAAAAKMAADPLGPPPAGADVADLAAWTVVGNVLLNLDETLMRR